LQTILKVAKVIFVFVALPVLFPYVYEFTQLIAEIVIGGPS